MSGKIKVRSSKKSYLGFQKRKGCFKNACLVSVCLGLKRSSAFHDRSLHLEASIKKKKMESKMIECIFE